MSPTTASPARRVAQLLSGYLCGTHSGIVGRGRNGKPADPGIAADLHRTLRAEQRPAPNTKLGGARWSRAEEALSSRLGRALDHGAIVDLIVFGSQAHGGLSGFSDVDAILVLEDSAADDPSMLKSLRPRVLAAQRAVLAYQPMQHHGFEVVTPSLLRWGTEALRLPSSALETTETLFGRSLDATLSDTVDDADGTLRTHGTQLSQVRAWPSHVWQTHRLIAMFELLPTFYLQSRGRPVPKADSFGEARGDFGDSWWPFDVLRELRLAWPRISRPSLEVAAASVRNPWLAVAGWRRLHAQVPGEVRRFLTPELLAALTALAGAMAEQANA
jgi:hypothetical protein